MLVLALPALLSPICGETSFEVTASMAAPARTRSVDRLVDLLPADAFLVVRAESIHGLLEGANQLMGKKADDPTRLSTQTLLEGLEPDVAQIAAQIDVHRPAGLALRFGAGDQPVLWLALPTSDAEALAKGLVLDGLSKQLSVIAAGDYVVAASEANVQIPLGGCAAIGQLEHTDLAAQLDIAAVLAKFRPLVDMGLDSAEGALEESSEAEQLAAEEYFDLTRDILDSARTLRLALDSQLDTIRATGELTVAEGSALAKLFGGTRRNLSSAGALLDPRAAFSYVSMSDPRNVGARQLQWTEAIAGAVPGKLQGLMQLEIDAWRAMLPKTTGLSVTNLDFALEGLRASSFVESTDPAGLVGDVQRVLGSPALAELGLRIEGPAQREVSGVTWTEYRMNMDLETIARFVDEDAVISPEDRAQAEKALQIFLGDGGLRVGIATVERFLVTRVGGDDTFARSTVSRIGGSAGSFDSGLVHALDQTQQVQAAWLMHLDVGHIMNQFADLASSLGQSIDMPVELVGDSFPLTVHAAVDGVRWRGGLELDARDLARFVQALEAGH
ncbi:MAG: hypothetical protein IT454_15405 [Planctomycetes bacterium]|nr:hypothetical protein [Planctomycetota bacterium]